MVCALPPYLHLDSLPVHVSLKSEDHTHSLDTPVIHSRNEHQILTEPESGTPEETLFGGFEPLFSSNMFKQSRDEACRSSLINVASIEAVLTDHDHVSC